MSHKTRKKIVHRHLQAITSADPLEVTESLGLEYMSDSQPGIQRRKRGKRFIYLDINGERIREQTIIERIEAIAIPPAYRDVWICPSENGHIQATGRDAKGRKQYRYHPLWRTVRDQTKFARMLIFSQSLPKLRENLEQDLSLPGLPKRKVLATVVKLMELTRIRVGNEDYARNNQTYGLTTLQDEHANIVGATISFQFRGKSGVEHNIQLKNRRLAKIVKRCQDIPGQDLFQYIDTEGNYQAITSGEINAYLKEISGQEFTAKDFRTWAGTVLAATHLAELELVTSKTQAQKDLAQVIKTVAAHLGNRPATCRKYYVHPGILEAYLDQTLPQAMQLHARAVDSNPHALRPEELAVVAILEQQLACQLQQEQHPEHLLQLAS
ncbi:MAG: DNA topoisomerase IB [Pegethrix bostrychoides GSE-TBD4-15B]|jgi:DNA topoisomerase-1|uniref:DNA topoisomerase n=1 Tax=Pegethrix bostrychoides GSE-TBD4-15B TaxID=2839662 RepID=A0A951P9N3_9CYAN|nr:DNA topoisomerase IB [Pegethrix bostrychoides GSE-TBD4-15B]